ncbi:hypothetical protein CDL15_Pgr022350 [Punica granatum]|uniref:Uncharacterized protein n=1 Tax=Punica granatum TaxID=22663 RepID=A0A218Y452_PUNGR|nr:hypothetical protein CDL15_Pgr022350 [Punica granatum]
MAESSPRTVGESDESETGQWVRAQTCWGLKEKGECRRRKGKGKGGGERKMASVGLKANGLGFSLTLACPSPKGRNETWALPEFGLNPELQNRPDSAIPRFIARFTSDFGFSESPP